MNKNKNFFDRLISFICVFLIVSSTFIHEAMAKQNTSFEQFITGVKITDPNGKEYSKDNPAKPGDKIKIFFDFALSDEQRNEMIQQGYKDIVYQYKCPEQILNLIKKEGIINTNVWIERTSLNENKIKFMVTPEGNIQVVFEELGNAGNIRGNICFESAFNKDIDEKIESIHININGTANYVPIYITPAVKCDVEKSGKINNRTNSIDWDIVISPKYEYESLKGISIVDYITTQYQEITRDTKVYCDGKQIPVSFNETNGVITGFDYTFTDDNTGKKHITYSTKIKNAAFAVKYQWCECVNTINAGKKGDDGKLKDYVTAQAKVGFGSDLIRKAYNEVTVDKDGNVVVGYNVIINEQGINLGDDVVLRDVLPEGTEFIDGTLEVKDEFGSKKDNIKLIHEKNNVITIGMGKVDKKYYITYKIKYDPKNIDFSNGKKYKNTISFDYGDTSHSSEADLPQKTPSSSELSIKKSGELLYGDKLLALIDKYKIKDEDIGNMILWTVKIGDDGKIYTKDGKYKFLDNIPAGLEYVEGTLRFSGGTVSDIRYTEPVRYANGVVKWDTTPLTCSIPSPINGGTEITFITRIIQTKENVEGVMLNSQPYEWITYNNSAYLDNNNGNAQVSIYIGNRILKNGNYNRQTKKFSWMVDFNYNPQTDWIGGYLLKRPRLKEVLPQGHKITMINGKYDVYAEDVKTGQKVQVGTDESPWCIDYYDEKTGIAQISWKESNERNYINSWYKFYFTTELKDSSSQKKLFEDGQEVDSTNTVYYYADNINTDDIYNKAEATVKIKKKDIMSKSHDNYKAGINVPWQIIVNQNFEDNIMQGAVIEDKLQDGLVLDTNSVKVFEADYDSENDSYKPGLEVTNFVKIMYDASQNKLSIKFEGYVPRGKAYIIKFTTVISDENISAINNSATFTGHDTKKTQASAEEFYFVPDGALFDNVLSINVEKYGEDGSKLEGAVFKLTEITIKNGKEFTATTDATGNTQFLRCLNPGEKYKLEEIKSPNGYYVKSEPIIFTAGDKNIKGNIAVHDIPRAVRLKKTDENGKILPGAEFELYKSDNTKLVGFIKSKDAEGNEVYWYDAKGTDKLVSDKQGIIRIKGLDAGKYYFKETKAPIGYKLSDKKYEFELSEKLDVSKLKNNYVDVVVINNKQTINFSFMKTDKDFKALSGAEFKLYKNICKNNSHTHDSLNDDINNTSCWSYIGMKTSGSNGFVNFENLETGYSYRLIETKAPDGYQLPQGCWKIDISDEGKVTITAIGRTPVFGKVNGDYKLINYKKSLLPLMGGGGYYPYIICGLLILVCVYIFRKRVLIKF